MDFADKYTSLQVRTNADTPHDAEVARTFGAVGIGLCRTEHMFFEGEKIKAMREMILAENAEGRRKALAKILPYQQADFKGIFKAMDGCPVNCTPARSSFARIRSSRSEGTGGDGGNNGRKRRIYPAACRTRCANTTRCWVTVVAVWVTHILKLRKCRLVPSWVLLSN